MLSHLQSPPVVVACAFAFLLGSIPFGLLMARIARGDDPRQKGSGNIGATNVSRVLGFWPWGFLTFALDFAKGVVPVLALNLGWFSGADEVFGPAAAWAVALCGVIGHCYSPWLRFKGGKGVATGLGALLVLSPIAAMIGVFAFLLSFAATRTGSLSSLSGILALTIAHLILAPGGPYLWLGGLLVFIILLRHESNLDALLQSREKTFT
jgi:glycerol-3-phosphate acyltransferase PlsY